MSNVIEQLATDARTLAAEVRARPWDVAAALDVIAREHELAAERDERRAQFSAVDRASEAIKLERSRRM